ncbi:MAG TPA: DUF6677 family protein [Tepidisphaeraceae bacterium]|jgi:hypothetical protein|nr:DUF6677 family protein [Tepidisphaeraceae bacterium]
MASAEQVKSHKVKAAWPPVVAIAGWLLPGAGYWMIGQRSRGLVVGITIIALFVLGLFIGGARVLEVPGYGPNGLPIRLVRAEFQFYSNHREEDTTIPVPVEDGNNPQIPGMSLISASPIGPVMTEEPFTEIRNKPWSIAQIMTGPIAILAGAWSVEQSRPINTSEGMLPAGSLSHARLNEIGVLYTAVAGMLNLMVIIDAAYRASHPATGGQGGSA